MADAEVLLGVRQVAALLRVHENTVRNWTDEGKLPCRRSGGQGQYRRYPAEEIGDLLRSGLDLAAGPTKGRRPDPVLEASEQALDEQMRATTMAAIANSAAVTELLRAIRNRRALEA